MNIGLIILYAISFFGVVQTATKHGQIKDEKHNIWITLFAWIIQFVLIWWALGWKFI